MFMLASPPRGEDSVPRRRGADLAANYCAIYSKHQSEASPIPHPVCSEALHSYGRSGDVGNRVINPRQLGVNGSLLSGSISALRPVVNGA